MKVGVVIPPKTIVYNDVYELLSAAEVIKPAEYLIVNGRFQ
jgi:hypothetical protein